MHAAISPDGDGNEEDTPINVEATGDWELAASGGELEGAATIATGSGNGSVTFSGKLANGDKLLDGTYTITLTEKSSGKKLRLPVKIESKLDLQVQYPAFSPNEEPDGHLDTNTLTITSNARWKLKATGLDNDGAAEVSGDRNATLTLDGTNNLESGKGTPLADGKYVVSLEVADRVPVATEVILDTHPPVISQISLEPDESDSSGDSFLLKAKIADSGLAGVDPDSILVSLPGTYEEPEYSEKTQSVTIRVRFDVRLASSGNKGYRISSNSTHDFAIGIRASDKVGNQASGGIGIPLQSAKAMLGEGQRLAWSHFESPNAPEHVLDRSMDKYLVAGAIVIYGGGAIALADSASAYAFVWIATKFGLDRALAAVAAHNTLAFLLDETGSVPGRGSTGRAALDTNALIYLTEGHPTLFTNTLVALAGRQPSVSRQAIHEYLRGGGDPKALANFIRNFEATVSSPPSSSLVKEVRAMGVDAADAKVLASAMEEGLLLITNDKRLRKKAPPGSTEGI